MVHFDIPLTEEALHRQYSLENSKHSSVAQLVEQLAVNELVVGSNPTRGARYKRAPNTLALFCILVLKFESALEVFDI